MEKEEVEKIKSALLALGKKLIKAGPIEADKLKEIIDYH